MKLWLHLYKRRLASANSVFLLRRLQAGCRTTNSPASRPDSHHLGLAHRACGIYLPPQRFTSCNIASLHCKGMRGNECVTMQRYPGHGRGARPPPSDRPKGQQSLRRPAVRSKVYILLAVFGCQQVFCKMLPKECTPRKIAGVHSSGACLQNTCWRGTVSRRMYTFATPSDKRGTPP